MKPCSSSQTWSKGHFLWDTISNASVIFNHCLCSPSIVLGLCCYFALIAICLALQLFVLPPPGNPWKRESIRRGYRLMVKSRSFQIRINSTWILTVTQLTYLESRPLGILDFFIFWVQIIWESMPCTEVSWFKSGAHYLTYSCLSFFSCKIRMIIEQLSHNEN